MRTLPTLLSALLLAGLIGAPAAQAAKGKPIVKTSVVKTSTASPRAKLNVPKAAVARKALIEKLYTFSARGPSAAAKKAVAAQTKRAEAKAGTKGQAPRVGLKQTMERLPKAERTQVVKLLLTNPRLATSLEARRTVAAFIVLRGLQGGKGLPLTTNDVVQMMASKRWSPKRLANLAIVLRTAVGIAQAEKIGAGAAFTKALKKFGIYGKYSRGVCPA